ncbi:hypothetical protein [Deinococcus cellulosilyticus]|uniref:Uncharacterized protein n=1 Tax=Deinococcus cellulosilyticus (strain DSM 18568 / NBRC 106333 / KACC 11606 / 5516J-15) TaxID=1223518 RepID=A0A511MZS8_DEIC1|nr:hypothetical protein [Deinococcus cellulosilyticus]GEM45831.1 hypothetical protein DC3_14660 [Deinococcus cellulosilyticus NBRC 106333 = KACC 11606]
MDTSMHYCDCEDLQEAISEGAILELVFARSDAEVILYAIPHPSGLEDDAISIRHCPFCGRMFASTPYMDHLARQQEENRLKG